MKILQTSDFKLSELVKSEIFTETFSRGLKKKKKKKYEQFREQTTFSNHLTHLTDFKIILYWRASCDIHPSSLRNFHFIYKLRESGILQPYFHYQLPIGMIRFQNFPRGFP